MLKCWIGTENGQKLELTENSEYDVINIEGLNPVSATINTYKIGVSDGEHYNSGYTNMRNIVIYIVPRVRANDIETNRLFLYKYFRPTSKIRLHFENSSRNVYIDGYVETFETSLYTMLQQFQISVICPQPWFISEKNTLISFQQLEKLFEYPFAIEENSIELSKFNEITEIECQNNGEIETGLIISIYATGLAYGIALTVDDIKIFKLIDDLELNTGDILTINTNDGEKTVFKTTSDGKIYNCINYVDISSTWLKLDVGMHKLSKRVDFGMENIYLEVKYHNKFIGM